MPKNAHGYSRAHVIDAMQSRGVSKWDLDTPALVLDLDKLEQNIAAMKASLASTRVAARPHVQAALEAEGLSTKAAAA